MQDPYLLLTGPTRLVVINMNPRMGPVTIEAELKVKGTVESEDKYIILDFISLLPRYGSGLVGLVTRDLELEISLGAIVESLEATIFIRITDGTWPTGFHSQFAARTASGNPQKVVLVEFGDDNVPPSDDDGMKLSRRVISVEASGMLVVTLKAWKGEEVMQGVVSFKAEARGRSLQTVEVGPCSIEVLVAWSRVPPYCEELVDDDWLRFCNC